MATSIDSCRLCHECLPPKSRRTIFSEFFRVEKQLAEVLGYVPRADDGLSKYVCGFCYTKLNKLSKFEMRALNNEKMKLLNKIRAKRDLANRQVPQNAPVSPENPSPVAMTTSLHVDGKRPWSNSPTPGKVRRNRNPPFMPTGQRSERRILPKPSTSAETEHAERLINVALLSPSIAKEMDVERSVPLTFDPQPLTPDVGMQEPSLDCLMKMIKGSVDDWSKKNAHLFSGWTSSLNKNAKVLCDQFAAQGKETILVAVDTSDFTVIQCGSKRGLNFLSQRTDISADFFKFSKEGNNSKKTNRNKEFSTNHKESIPHNIRETREDSETLRPETSLKNEEASEEFGGGFVQECQNEGETAGPSTLQEPEYTYLYSATKNGETAVPSEPSLNPGELIQNIKEEPKDEEEDTEANADEQQQEFHVASVKTEPTEDIIDQGSESASAQTDQTVNSGGYDASELQGSSNNSGESSGMTLGNVVFGPENMNMTTLPPYYGNPPFLPFQLVRMNYSLPQPFYPRPPISVRTGLHGLSLSPSVGPVTTRMDSRKYTLPQQSDNKMGGEHSGEYTGLKQIGAEGDTRPVGVKWKGTEKEDQNVKKFRQESLSQSQESKTLLKVPSTSSSQSPLGNLSDSEGTCTGTTNSKGTRKSTDWRVVLSGYTGPDGEDPDDVGSDKSSPEMDEGSNTADDCDPDEKFEEVSWAVDDTLGETNSDKSGSGSANPEINSESNLQMTPGRRFPDVNERFLLDLESKRNEETTNLQTKWAVKVFKNITPEESNFKEGNPYGQFIIDIDEYGNHKVKPAGTGKRKCNVCGSYFSTISSLRRHERIHTGSKPYKCDVCGYRSSYLSYLKVHQRIHSGIKPYECDMCEFKAHCSSSLKAHQRIHTGVKPHICDVCDYRTCDVGNLRRHQMIHTGEKRYMCDICGYKTTQTSMLKTHKRKHTGEKPYKCELCGYSATQAGTLNRHLKMHMKGVPYQCTMCGYKAKDINSFQWHLRSHTRNKSE